MTGPFFDFEELHRLFHPTTPEAEIDPDEFAYDPDHDVKAAKEDRL